MEQQTVNPIHLAHEYAEAAINAFTRAGTADMYSMPVNEDRRVLRLTELYASQVLGAISPKSRQEMLDLEASLTNGL